ncbi:hypothetical protein JCM17380_24510 [Desulfosporosinus burensis]
MRSLATLIRRYGVMFFEGSEVEQVEIAREIYKEFIDLGVLSGEMADYEFNMPLLADFTLPDEVKEALAAELEVIAEDDLDEFVSTEEYDIYEYAEIDTLYTMSLVRMNLERRDKTTEMIPLVFTALKDITLYVDNKCVVESAENIMTGRDADIGTFGLLAVEDAKDALDSLGIEGMLIAEQIPENAVAVIVLIKTNKDHDIMFDSDMYVIHEATEYVARI